MITCDRFDNCKRAGIIPLRVKRGYDPCRNAGVYQSGSRAGETCYFTTFPEVDVIAANKKILQGKRENWGTRT